MAKTQRRRIKLKRRRKSLLVPFDWRSFYMTDEERIMLDQRMGSVVQKIPT
jgi:hypothetical protein